MSTKNIELYYVLKEKFPLGQLYTSNVTDDPGGFEFKIPDTEYSVGCNRRWLGIRKNGETFSLLAPGEPPQDLSGKLLEGFEKEIAELIIDYF